MSRPKTIKPLTERICEACAAVNAVPKRGHNAKYPYQRATDIEAAFRHELFKRNVLLLANESEAVYVPIPTNGGETLTECRLSVAYRMTDGKETIGPDTHHGVGRDIEDKGLYKAKTGARKYFLKGLGLIPDEADDPEFDGQQAESGETLDDVAPRRIPAKEKPIRDFEIRAIEDACADTHKTVAEISEAMLTRFKAAKPADLKRHQFKEALSWASNGAGTLAPKPQAAPPLQNSLPLTKAAPSFEMRVGGKTHVIEPKAGGFAI